MELGYIISGTLVFFIFLYLAYKTYTYIAVYGDKNRIYKTMVSLIIAIVITSLITKDSSIYPFCNFAFLPAYLYGGVLLALLMILDRVLWDKYEISR